MDVLCCTYYTHISFFIPVHEEGEEGELSLQNINILVTEVTFSITLIFCNMECKTVIRYQGLWFYYVLCITVCS
jgi:hypothetical protein